MICPVLSLQTQYIKATPWFMIGNAYQTTRIITHNVRHSHAKADHDSSPAIQRDLNIENDCRKVPSMPAGSQRYLNPQEEKVLLKKAKR
jgi:hypothetical protein